VAGADFGIQDSFDMLLGNIQKALWKDPEYLEDCQLYCGLS
jgi:hypothetical protein